MTAEQLKMALGMGMNGLVKKGRDGTFGIFQCFCRNHGGEGARMAQDISEKLSSIGINHKIVDRYQHPDVRSTLLIWVVELKVIE